MSRELAQKVAIFAGRFQVPHAGHAGVVREMLANSGVGRRVIVNVDGHNPDNRNPHNSRQIFQMFNILFPWQFKSGEINFRATSEIGVGLNHAKMWEFLGDGDPKNVIAFFGNKESPNDIIDGKHYMLYLQEKFGINLVSIAPKHNLLSASSILADPYGPLGRYVDSGVRKNLAGIWRTAYENDCLVCEVDEINDGAYERFASDFAGGFRLSLLRDGSIYRGKNHDIVPATSVANISNRQLFPQIQQDALRF